MRDLLLQCAGLLTIAVAIVHGVLGETKVFARARIEPERLRTLIRLVWQASTVAWIGGGVLLLAAPSMGSEMCIRDRRCGGDGGSRLLTAADPQYQGAARWKTAFV